MTEMAQISNQNITGFGPLPADQSIWEITVSYDVNFRDDEVGGDFDDAVKLWEDDRGAPFGGGDDQITPYPIPDRFTAFSSVVSRQKSITVFRDQLDTEIGDEEVKAQIWLRRADSGGPADDEVYTPIQEMSP
ncbi:hypothetical protein [Streptomyces alanosinicus]|uniref:Uncharacterized protein n=1 Tax=Streptomyces alanosinicus TaxID=68171 RepID=A0A918YBY3_9ACTN|nr:hypothetical protein [Streptomyces alanosinicus]GHD98249.1 hypothetical protein GCM10010339_04670 [Streptomyces alanosinicus]